MATKQLSTIPSSEFNDDIRNLMNAVKADINGRVGIGTSSPVQKLDVAGSSQIGTPTFTGSGLNDLTLGGTFNQPYTQTLRIEIDGTGTPDTFKWSIDGGNTWVQTGVAITGAAQNLNYIGVTVTFGATTGHTVGDYWEATLTPASGNVNMEGGLYIGGNLFATKLHNNITVGTLALGAGSNTGNYNSAFGMQSLYHNTTGNYNSAFGMYSLFNNTKGYNNVAFGTYSLYMNTGGYYNCAFGHASLLNNMTGGYNIAIGYGAGRYITDNSANQTGNNSVFIGYNTKANADGETNQIVIGANQIGYGSYTVRIGNLGLGQIGTTLTPRNNHDLVIELTANDTITFKVKGTDGTVRSATLTLS